MAKIVLDTSVIINGIVSKKIETGLIKDIEILIPVAVLDELQTQASKKRDQGFLGLNEITKLQDYCTPYNFTIKFVGDRPSLEDIKLSDSGRIDALIIDIAKKNDATLYTSDKVQALVAEAEKISVDYQDSVFNKQDLEFLRFFDSETMSVHLKEGLKPMAKKGHPGSFELVEIEDHVLTHQYLREITTQILDITKMNAKSNLEISKVGATVVQHEDYRIAITQQPFSEAYEITIVHPIVRLSLNQYGVSEKLMDRFAERAEGVIISGPPGSGKSTLASSLADYYHKEGKIVKTFESPRDLQVDPGITQYTRLEGSFENSADILLLVRPDYTIFDEVRRHEDFGIFSDLRLAGVGMVGVIHANSPIDAVQRFIGKIELGIIPSVLDTVVFVKDGTIDQVYGLELKVKVPSGMVEQDLARPVIEIRDFETNTLEYEIYTFGEENVIVPVSQKGSSSGMGHLAEEKIRDVFKKFDPYVEVEILSENSVNIKVDKSAIPSIIGRGGATINEIEKILKIRINVMEKDFESHSSELKSELPFDFSESKTSLLFNVGKENSGSFADIYVNDKYLTAARIGRKGQIKIPRRSTAAKRIMTNAGTQNDIQIFMKN